MTLHLTTPKQYKLYTHPFLSSLYINIYNITHIKFFLKKYQSLLHHSVQIGPKSYLIISHYKNPLPHSQDTIKLILKYNKSLNCLKYN